MRVSTPLSHRSGTRRRLHPGRLTASLILGNVVLSGTAWADYAHSKVVFVNPDRIEVVSNGVAYTQPAIPLVSLFANLSVEMDAGVSGRIKSWRAWIVANPQAPGYTGAKVHFSQHAHSESYPVGSRPKKLGPKSANVTVPYGTLAPFLIGQCNWMADDLRSKGMSNQVIFSQDRVIPVRIRSMIEADFSGIAGAPVPSPMGDGSEVKTLELVCKSQGGVNPDIGPVVGGVKAETEARLTSVTARVLHDSRPQSCPTEATARVIFVADTDGPFTWRFTSASGKVSPPIRMVMRASDKQGNVFIRTYEQKFMVGEKASATGSGAIGGGAGASGLAPTPRPEPGKSGPRHQQVDAGYVAPVLPNVLPAHQDALRAVVLSAHPGSVEHSAPASYHVRCPVVLNPGVGTLPGGVQGSTSPAAQPAMATGVLVPGAVKTAPPAASLPPGGVRQPVLPAAPAGQRLAPTVLPATPVARPPVPAAGEANAHPARTPRIGALRRQSAEEGKTSAR